MNGEDATHVTSACVVNIFHQIKKENKTRGKKKEKERLSKKLIKENKIKQVLTHDEQWDATHVTPACVVSTSHQIMEENKTRGEKNQIKCLKYYYYYHFGWGRSYI